MPDTTPPYPPFDANALADEIAARLHPAHTRWVRDKKHPDGGYEAPVSARDGDSSTMTTFTASDGNMSMRSMTWREVVQIVHDALTTNASSEPS